MADISGVIYGTTSNSLIDSKIEWEETVSVVSNQGTVTARLYLRTRTGYVTSSGNSTFTLYIGSASTVQGPFSFSIGSGSGWVLANTAYAYVPHNSDGTKSITISASGNMSGSSVSSITCSSTVALYAIPRASTFTLPSSVDVDGVNTVTVNISRNLSAFTHRVRIYTESTYAGSTYKTEITGVDTSTSYAIPAAWRLSMPTSVSKVINVEVTTFNGATQIGNPVYGTFTITVPASVKPIVDASNVTLVPVQADEISGFTHYVQGLSACGATFDSLASDFSSEVAITGFYIQIGSAKTSTAPYNTATLKTSGDFTITVGVTDARGRTGTYTQTITVYPYDDPLVTGLNVFRSNSAGVATATGGYVAVSGSTSHSDCGGDNSITYFRARYKAASDGTYGAWDTLTSGGTTLIGGGALLSTVTYNVEVQVVDEVGESATYSYVIPTADVAFNIKAGGNGVAFGKYAETDGVLESAWEIRAPNMNIATYTSVTQLGQVVGVPTINQCFNAMPLSSILRCPIGEFASGEQPSTTSGGLGNIEMYKASIIRRSHLIFHGKIASDGEYRKFMNVAGDMFEGAWQRILDASCFLNFIYPVGSIYLSTTSTSPATLFGGTWERIQDQFLLAAGSTYAAGATGGEAEHTLTVDEMPEHSHNINRSDAGGTTSSSYHYATVAGNYTNGVWNIDNAGGGQAHNNMPPYLAVYVWKRTA